MDLETVKYEKKGAVAIISFNRPEVRNAFNAKMTEDILEALIQAKKDPEIRAIVLTGEGLSFSAGADLSSRDNKWSDTEEALIKGYLPSLREIMEMPKPVISAVNGAAAGIGSAYAMACDLTIMSQEAYILHLDLKLELRNACQGRTFAQTPCCVQLAYLLVANQKLPHHKFQHRSNST